MDGLEGWGREKFSARAANRAAIPPAGQWAIC